MEIQVPGKPEKVSRYPLKIPRFASKVQAGTETTKKPGRSRGNGELERKIRNLEREIRNLKKQLRLLKKEWEKRKRFYQTQTQRFKNEQDRWIRNQRQQHPNKIIKYVFVDDIRAIKVYRRGKATVRFVTRDGGEFESEEAVDIEYADPESEAARDAAVALADEQFMQFTEEELGDPDIDPDDEPAVEDPDADEDVNLDEEAKEQEDYQADEALEDEYRGMDEAQLSLEPSIENSVDLEEFDAVEAILDDHDDDDGGDFLNTSSLSIKVDDEPLTPVTPQVDLSNYVEKEDYEKLVRDIQEFIEELKGRTKDLHSINTALDTAIDQEELDGTLRQLVERVKERHLDLTTTLRGMGALDVVGLTEEAMAAINQNWQDEIYRVIEVSKSRQAQDAPLGVTETVNQMLEEMDARTNDLVALQDLQEKTDMSPEEKEEKVKEILDAAEDRHANAKSHLQEKDPEVAEFLDRRNNTWEIALQQLGLSITEDDAPAPLAQDEPERKESISGPPGFGRHDRTPTLRELIVASQDGDKTALQELTARTDDLKQILDAYDTPNGPDLMRDLRTGVETRHQEQLDGEGIPEDMQEDNQDWEELLGKLTEKSESAKQQSDANKALMEGLTPEMDARNEDLQTLLNVLNGDQPPSDLEELALNVDERHKSYNPIVEEASPAQEVYRRLLFDIAEKKQVAALPELEEQRDQMGDFNQFVADQCLKELKSRIGDVATVKQLDPADEDTMQEMLGSVAERHEKQKQALRQANKNMPPGDAEGENQRENLLEKISSDNDKWLTELGMVQQQAKDSRKLRQRYAQCLDELNERTADLERIQRMLEVKEEEEKEKAQAEAVAQDETKQVEDAGQDAGGAAAATEDGDGYGGDEKDETDSVEQFNYQDQVAQMLEEIEERHVEQTEKMEATLTAADTQETSAEYNTNNGDWRQAIGNILGYQQEEEKVEEVDGTPWLKKDPLRNEYIDSILVDAEQLGSPFCLRDIGVYLNRMFAEDEDTILYMPIDTSSDDLNEVDREVLSKTFDGVLLNRLVNLVQPDFLDLRAVHTPDPIDPFPLSDDLVMENIQLLLGTCKALGVKVGRKYRPRDWFKPEKQARMLRDICDGIARRYIDFLVNLDICPQLVRLQRESEDVDVVKHLDGVDWLPRWVNHLNGRDVAEEIQDFNRDLSRAVGTYEDAFDGEAAASSDDMTNAQALQDMADAKDVKVKIQAQDLADNNRKCQDLFAAQVFMLDSGMPPLSAEEIRQQEEALSKDSSTDESYLNWLNSLGLVDEEIDNLYRDLSDGVVLLKLLDRLRANVVQWKGVRLKIRHKFDKMTNCKRVVQYCKDPFNFKIIGFDSDDLVAGNQKFIHSLLWQIMRYHATRALADLNHGQQVRDEDIIQFANLQVTDLESPFSRPIRGLKDRSLANGLFYLDVIRAIAPDAVRQDLIHADVPENPKPDDGSLQERLENVRYAASLVRRLGGELFVMPEDLLRMDARAVLSLLAAVMTLSVKDRTEAQDDEDDMIDQALSGPLNG